MILSYDDIERLARMAYAEKLKVRESLRRESEGELDAGRRTHRLPRDKRCRAVCLAKQ